MQRSAGRAFQAEGRPAAELEDNEALGAGLKCMRGSGERHGGGGRGRSWRAWQGTGKTSGSHWRV